MDDFKLKSKIINYNNYARTYLVSDIPNVHRDIRIHLLDENYNLLKQLYIAIYNKGNIRNKSINDMIVTISLIDYLLSTLLKLCKKQNHVIKSIDYLTSIKNMTYAWQKSIEVNGSKK